MHADWCEFGFQPDRFWALTLREIQREMTAANKRKVTEYNNAMSIAWHTAYLHRVEKMPKLKELLIVGKTSKKKTPDWQAQQAAFGAMVARQKG